MSATRRTTGTRLTRLAAKTSPYHSSVSLYHDVSTTQSSPSRRRTRRVKQEQEPDALSSSVSVVAPPQDDTKTARIEEDQARSPSLSPPPPPPPLPLPPTSKSKSKSNTKLARPPLDVPHAAPDRWAEAYAAIEDMRSRIVAPVDTMGCEQAQLKEQDPKNRRFATLVSLMLSSQTKDEVTDSAMTKLRTALGGSVSVQAILAANDATLSEAIAKVGFWRRKTEYIKRTAQRLHEEYDDDIPKTVDELCSLPGVGPKMAFLALQVAWKLNVGIGVDVHVHRITNRLGWHARPTRHPEETRINLESWLPKALHSEINLLLVGFGQTICLPVGPKCGECTLSESGLCPSARSAGSGSTSRTKGGKSKSKGKNKVKAEDEDEDEDEEKRMKEEDVTDRRRSSRSRSKSKQETERDGEAGPRIKIELEVQEGEKAAGNISR